MLKQREAIAPGYGLVAKSLHWMIVALLIAQFTIAWTMPDIGRGTQPEGLIGLHLSTGMLILFIAILRLLWRMAYSVPLVSDNVPPWQNRAAQMTHALFYLLLLALPLMGWANASSRGWRVDFFGLVSLPPILAKGSRLGATLGDIHTLTSYVLLVVVGLHVAAALYHHFWLRDGVLNRMLPGGD